MADLEKLVKLGHLKSLAEKAKANDDILSGRIDTLEGSSHSHSNASVLNGISSELVEKWTAAEPNVLTGVKVNNVALEAADKIVNIAIATGTTDGAIDVNGAAIAVYGLKAMAFKESVSEEELAVALAQKINAKADAADVSELTQKVTTLVGQDATKSVRAIAAEEVAKLVAENPDESLDTIEKIAAWIQSHPDEAADMNVAIQALQAKVVLGEDDEGTEYATVKEYVEAVVEGAIEDADLSNYVRKEDGKRLMEETEGTKLAGISAGATKTASSSNNGKIMIDDVEVTVYTEPADVLHGSIATDGEVDEVLEEIWD